MRLYMNTTSPMVRLARIAAAEKGLAGRIETVVVDPWADPAEFLRANPAGRVPCLVTDEGVAIAESGLILQYLERLAPEPSLWPAEGLAETLAQAGLAYGAIEASVAVIISRKSNEAFDSHMVGEKRFRTMTEAFRRLDADPPRDMAERVDIANIATAVAVDYIGFRFTDRDWLGGLPNLRAWRERQGERPSLASTYPHL